MKKIISAILAALLCLLLTSCKTADITASEDSPLGEGAAAKRQKISLLYSFGDGFNPYTALTAQNRELCTLIFDSLVKIDNEFNAVYSVAESIKLKKTVCTVKLKNVKFSDSTALNANDVLYSYKAALASKTRYASQLKGVKSAEVTDSKTIVFTLAHGDQNFINLLDFPIMKAESDKKTDEDGVALAPIGTGRYYVDNEKQILLLNEKHFGKKGEISQIELINAPDESSVTHYVEIGATDLYYTDISDGSIVRMSGKRTTVNLNRLVYIGINASYGNLRTQEMRYAISSAINRSEICKSAYHNNAMAAKGFFNPLYKPAAPTQTIDINANLQITVENLGEIGYNRLDSRGYYCNSSGNHAEFTLLVNSENATRVLAAELIASQCRAAGIEIKVIKRSYSEYKKALKNNDFQLYLGEIQIMPNLDVAELVLPGGSAAFGVRGKKASSDGEQAETEKPEEKTEKSPLSSAIKNYRAGKIEIADLAAILNTEMPQIPVCFRNGLLFYSSEIEGEVEASASDIYFSIEEYKFK